MLFRACRKTVFGLLLSAFLVTASGSLHADSEDAPFWLLFYHFTETETLCAVTWSSKAENSEPLRYGVLINMPHWILEAQGQSIESKSGEYLFNYLFLPHSFKSFCHQHGIDSEAMKQAEGGRLIDLGPFSDKFSPVPSGQLRAILDRITAWDQPADWTVHPRPEPQPPKWLNRPLNRKFYYEVPE